MPHSYNYSEANRLLSAARLSSYRDALSPNSDAQLIGAYNWNLAVVGAFYPLVQIIEVALRNALHNAATQTITCSNNESWFDAILYEDEFHNGNTQKPKQVCRFHEKILSAKKSAKKSLSDKGIQNPKPTIDQIISQTDFSTWEYLLDKHFYNGSNNRFLWPNGLAKAFKKLPRTSKTNKKFHQRDIIRRRISEIRSFRNRISHNEPCWVSTSNNSKEKIIDGLIAKLENMMELLIWISPRFNKYVQDSGVDTKIRQLLNVNELHRYMHLLDRYDVNDINDLCDLISITNTDNERSHFTVRGNTSILIPCNTLLAQ